MPPEPKAFYLRPLPKAPVDVERPWYTNVPVGVNLSTKYTNHSLRATSASRLFVCNIPEKLIQEKTGHRSLSGLRVYERTTSQQEKTITKILESSSAMPEGNDVENVQPVKQPIDSSAAAPVFSGQLQNCVFNFYTR